jgi:hypothetical protein
MKKTLVVIGMIIACLVMHLELTEAQTTQKSPRRFSNIIDSLDYEMILSKAKNVDKIFTAFLESSRLVALHTNSWFLQIFVDQFDPAGVRLSRYFGDIRNTNYELKEMLYMASVRNDKGLANRVFK